MRTKLWLRELGSGIETLKSYVEQRLEYLEIQVNNIETDRKIERLRENHIDINRKSQVVKVPADFKKERRALINFLTGTPAVKWSESFSGYALDLAEGWCLMKGGEEWLENKTI